MKSHNSYENHHYVPRCYFIPWENANRQVLVYERKAGIVIPPYWQSTKRICVQRNLYSYTESIVPTKRQLLEQSIFRLIDDKAAKVLAKLAKSTDPLNLTEAEGIDFSVFLVSLRVRTPEFFNANAISAENAFRKGLQSSETDPDVQDLKPLMNGDTFLGYAEKNYLGIIENRGRDILARLITDDKFFNPIYELHWKVFRFENDGYAPLLTSDRPLLLKGEGGKPSLLGLPVAPDRYFIACANEKMLEKICRYHKKKLSEQANISSIQQAQAKAFAKDSGHSPRLFEKRLGHFHSILPFADPNESRFE